MLDYLLDEDYLLDDAFLLTLDNFTQKDINYVKNSFLLGALKKRNEYLYKNYIKIKDKKKWFRSEKEHKEWAESNNKIKYLTYILSNF